MLRGVVGVGVAGEGLSGALVIIGGTSVENGAAGRELILGSMVETDGEMGDADDEGE